MTVFRYAPYLSIFVMSECCSSQTHCLQNMYPQFTHYGVEFYGAGTAATTVRCNGERDLACSAGNGEMTVTATHLSSFGVALGLIGCGGGIPTGPV